MTINRTETIQIIAHVYGLSHQDAERKLLSLNEEELANIISNYQKDLDMGVSVQKGEKSSVFLADYDNQTYTDNKGNTITEYFDGNNVVERIIKDKNGNQTTVTYRNNRPFTQIKNIQGNIEKSKFEYHDDAEQPYVTVETTKADKTKVTTNTQSITENGDIVEDYIKDRKTVKPDGTTITLTPRIIDLKNPTNDKKTFFKGECMEEVVETFKGKKRTTYFEGSSFDAQGRRILTQTSDNAVYYNSDNKPVYNHKEYVKKQQEEAYKAEYEKRMERTIPLKGSHTNVLSGNIVTLGKAENVTVKEFISNILGIDINSETGKKLADRFVRVPDDALQKISYADYEAQTLGTGKFAPKTNDYSNASFEKIARDLRQKSGVNIETQDEVTQHKIQMTIQENALQNRKTELGIDANNFAKESLAAVYEQAAGMLMQDRNRTMNPLDPKDYAHFAKNIGTALLDNASMGILAKDAFHQASDYEDFAQKLRNLPADSPEEFSREYEKLTGQKYDVNKVKGFMEFLNKSNLDKMDDSKRSEFLGSDKYKSEFAKAFGFRTTENTEKQLKSENTAEEFAGIVGDVYLLAQTGGLSSMKTLVSGSGKLTGKLLSKTPLSKKAAGVISETAARATGGAVSMASLTTIKSVSGNIVYDEIDATDFNTWKNTAVGIGESGVLGAVGGVVGKMAEPVVKYIEKPAEREAEAMLKAFSNKGEMSAKELMQTVSEESGISLDGLFKMNKQELVQLIRTTAGKGFEITAEAGAFGVTETVIDSSDKSFSERLEEQYEMLTKMKGASKLVQMVTAGKAGKAALINSSKVLNETKVKPTKTPDGKTQFELTLPNGRKIITENPEHALATCNYLMQAELVEQAVRNAQPQTEWKKITIGGEEFEVAITRDAKGVEIADFNKARRKNPNGEYEEFKLGTKNDLLSTESDNISDEPRIKIEYKDEKTEKEILIEKVDKMVKNILSRFDTSAYNSKRQKEGIELLEELLWDDVDLKLTAEEKEIMKAVIVKQSYGNITADKIRDNDKSIVHQFLEKYNQMTEGNSNIIWVLRCLKDNNGLNDEQFNPFEVYNTLYKGKIFKRLSAQEINIVNEILLSNKGSVEEQIERAKFDYSEIANRDLVNLVINQLGLRDTATDYFKEFLYCSKEEFEAKIQRLNERPELIDNVKKFKFETWKNLLNMPIEEYRKIVTPVENREGATLDTDTYRRTIKTELKKPQPYDIKEALEVSSERNFILSFGTRAYRAEKLVQFKPLDRAKTEEVTETLPTTKESMTQLEQNGKVQIDIKNKGGLNPTRAEEPIIHPDDISRLGQVEKAGIKIKYGAKTNWSNSKIARDIMQNFYDGNGHTLEGVNIEVTKTPEGKYLVKISGEGNYDYDRLESLGNSSKDGDSSNAGAFGEGTRIVAVNLLARPDTKNIKYACGEWEMNFGRSSDDIQTADMTQTLNKNSQKVKGNYIEFETADEELVKEILNSKDYFYQPYNKDFQNFDYENEFFGFKLLPNEKGNIYVVQRYETQDGIENSLENLSLVFKKMPNDPEITEKNDGQEFEIGTGRDRILLSERKIGELISRYLKTVPDEELMQTLATMKDSWIVSKEKTPNKMLLPLIEEAKSRKLGFAFEEPDTKTKKIMQAFGIGLKYMAVPEVASPNDIEMIRLMGYTPVIHELAGMGIQEFARPNENQKQPIVPTQRELQKLQLVSEAVGVIKDNLELENYDHISDKEAHAPTIIVENGTDPNEAAEAILSNGELKGEWMTRAHLECERFTTLLSTKLHEITHKYGGDISSSFSDALVNLQVTIMKGLVHNPESLAKLRVLEDIFNEVDGKSVVENYVIDGKFNASKFNKDIEKILSEPFDYVEYKEKENNGSKVIKGFVSEHEIKPISSRASRLLNKIRRFFNKSSKFYPIPTTKYEIPVKKYELENPERQEYTPIKTTLPTTNEALMQLSETGGIEISIPNKGGMNPTNAENPIIHTDDISKLDKTLKAKIKIRYGAKTNWSEFKIARDIMQNFYDGNGHTLEGVDIKIDREPDGSYRVRISGDGQYDYSHLESIGDSTKDGDFDNAGAFGEGTRIVAVNLLSHLDTPYVKYACGDWEMNFGRSSNDIQTADMTQTLHRNTSSVKGNYIEFKTGNENLIQEIVKSKDFFYHPENPDFQNMLYENEFFGIKVLEDKEKQGSFYLVQKYETENPEQDMKGISIVLKKGDKDPDIQKAQGKMIIVSSTVETGRDRVSISSSQAQNLGRTYGMTMNEQELVHTISALRDFYTLPIKDLLGRNLDNEKLINSTEINFICGLVSAAASKHIQIDLKDLKMATVSDFDLKYNEKEVSDLLNRGYKFVPSSFKEIGIPDVNLSYKNEHRIKSLEPTRIEHQKLQLINEAIQLFAKNDTRGTIPKITPDKLYIFDASAQKHTDIYATVNDKNLNGLFVDRQYLENTDFLNCVTRMIASSLHVHGDDISANYSYELTDLITSEVNTLMHKPEVAQKLRILKERYDTLK